MPNARVVGGWLVTSDGRISHFEEKEFYVGANFLIRGSLPRVREVLVDRAEQVRDFARAPVIISSGVRSQKANEAAGGDDESDHLSGGAMDFKVVGKTPWDMVNILNDVTDFGALGRFGIYHRDEGGHNHMDVNITARVRRFVKIGGKYVELMLWIYQHFPQASDAAQVPRAQANRLLGF